MFGNWINTSLPRAVSAALSGDGARVARLLAMVR
jgi:hypothetical protein